MLLGVVIHACFAMMLLAEDAAWTKPLLDLIHGFRMPLFFVVSGFFTAMLWRRRGLRALLWHRFRRIFLPFLLGMATIVPLTLWAYGAAVERGGEVRAARSAQDDIWTAAARGDLEAIKAHQAAGASVDDPNPTISTRPLVWAAAAGQLETTRWLLDQGADVNAKGQDDITALHMAAFLGRPRIVALLLAHGADAAATSKGQPPIRMTDPQSEEWIELAASVYGLELDEQEAIQGRAEAAELLRQHDPDAARDPGEPLVALLSSIPAMHLWFLWYLWWLVVGFAVVAWILERWPLPLPPAGLVLSPARYLWLVPLTLLPQLSMSGYGPDTSGVLLLDLNLLAYYAIFFGFGALYYAYDDADGRVSQQWRLALPLGLLVAFPLGLWLQGERAEDHWLLYCGLQVIYVWLMTFGAMGLFRRYFAKQSETMRYVSDSSYFLYLAHVPLMVALQLVMQSWPAPSLVKLVINCVVTSAILLVLYDKLVRYRWLGRFLNGPRARPAAK